MNGDLIELAKDIIIPIIVVIPTYLALRRLDQRDRAGAMRDEAEATDIIRRIAREELVDALQDIQEHKTQIKQLEKEIGDLQALITNLYKGALALYGQLTSLGARPVYVPEKLYTAEEGL